MSNSVNIIPDRFKKMFGDIYNESGEKLIVDELVIGVITDCKKVSREYPAYSKKIIDDTEYTIEIMHVHDYPKFFTKDNGILKESDRKVKVFFSDHEGIIHLPVKCPTNEKVGGGEDDATPNVQSNRQDAVVLRNASEKQDVRGICVFGKQIFYLRCGDRKCFLLERRIRRLGFLVLTARLVCPPPTFRKNR